MSLKIKKEPTVGERIRNARKKAGLTQEALAAKVNLATVTIRQYEADKRYPKADNLLKIASALHIPISQLINVRDVDVMVSDDIAIIQQLTGASLVDGNLIYPDGTRNFPLRDNRHNSDFNRLNAAFDQLNENGQKIAAERVEELTKIPEYRKENE